ncbi:hypothetical protein [Microbacterium sp.]|uniref:hypothetical protein n=1 Tax=Microbacterium sp. TaxID=51671 RepID=UPI0026281455|nr:hypothetical protein [Microbacterium sp.]MCV0335257.1 hypothetical protein [Microbacterium sp.]MCV0375360.1 hypothetical protein [Microbacterium sp.]MCV0388121.1 hypothetical protein [Microbacterium sp.]MCV0416648.1 hypothetical protein [Microbacterium sp.]MCV0423261.1 hypothetical protein [Microbacterium sp.]
MTEDELNPWARIIGPCYTVASMARTLRWTEAEVVEAGHTLRLLMLLTDDDVYLFPAFQLRDGRVIEGLTNVLRVLQTGTLGRWTWAQWLNTPYPHGEPTAVETMLAGRLDEILLEATHDAWSWSS